MKKMSDFEDFANSKHIHDERIHDLIKSVEAIRLAVDGLSLNKMKDIRKEYEVRSTFSAIIDNAIYVADRNIISKWEESPTGTLECTNIIYWHEIQSLSISSIDAFTYDRTIPMEMQVLHDRVFMLYAMSDMIDKLVSPFMYDNEKYETWCYTHTSKLEQRDFNGLKEAIYNIINPILYGSPLCSINLKWIKEDILMKNMRFQADEIEKIERELASRYENAFDIDFFTSLK